MYSVIGGVLWGVGVTMLGYGLGSVGFVRSHIEIILIGVVALSFVPIGIELLRQRRKAAPEGT